MRLGELLIQNKIVTEEQLLKGLSRHYRTHEKVGECLILEGYISESALLQALSAQLGVPFFEVIPSELISTDSLALIPGAIAKRWCVIAGETETGFLVFYNDDTGDIAGHLAQKHVSADYALARKSEIRRAIDTFFKG